METSGTNKSVETENPTFMVSDLEGDAEYTFEVKTLAAYEEADLPDVVSGAMRGTVTTCKFMGAP